MTCYTCDRLAGFAEPVPGSDTLRLVCADHKGPEAQAYDPADLAAGALFGLPWDRLCEHGCGCRYGTTDPDVRDCACDGPCCEADHNDWYHGRTPCPGATCVSQGGAS